MTSAAWSRHGCDYANRELYYAFMVGVLIGIILVGVLFEALGIMWRGLLWTFAAIAGVLIVNDVLSEGGSSVWFVGLAVLAYIAYDYVRERRNTP